MKLLADRGIAVKIRLGQRWNGRVSATPSGPPRTGKGQRRVVPAGQIQANKRQRNNDNKVFRDQMKKVRERMKEKWSAIDACRMQKSNTAKETGQNSFLFLSAGLRFLSFNINNAKKQG